ncbi:hypothetical protein DINM_002343 [Dirofilaria immitis]|nr:hypothetical protein [Dirofilaria immitis]
MTSAFLCNSKNNDDKVRRSVLQHRQNSRSHPDCISLSTTNPDVRACPEFSTSYFFPSDVTLNTLKLLGIINLAYSSSDESFLNWKQDSEVHNSMTSSTSKKVNKPDNTKKEKERELGLEIAQLKLRIQERDQTIFDLEEQIRGKDAIIVDKCQIIERLEQSHFERLSPDQDSLEETSEISQNTIRCMNVNESDVLKTKEEAHLLEELEEERRCRLKFMEQNELLLQQWDDALVYVEQVQKMLQAELKHTSTLIDENATLRKRINETVIISKNHIQFVAILLVLLSLYLYTLS